jgi:hypothetical protein
MAVTPWSSLTRGDRRIRLVSGGPLQATGVQRSALVETHTHPFDRQICITSKAHSTSFKHVLTSSPGLHTKLGRDFLLISHLLESVQMEQSGGSTPRGKLTGQSEPPDFIYRTKNSPNSPETRARRYCQNSPATFRYDAGGLTRAFSLRISANLLQIA